MKSGGFVCGLLVDSNQPYWESLRIEMFLQLKLNNKTGVKLNHQQQIGLLIQHLVY